MCNLCVGVEEVGRWGEVSEGGSVIVFPFLSYFGRDGRGSGSSGFWA